MRKKDAAQTRFGIHLRCSTDDQKEGDFTTIDTQRSINARHVASLGGEVVAEFADEGKTGTSLKRSGFDQLLAAAKAGTIDAVCVTYMSRLGRGKAFDIAEYLLKEAGVKVELVNEKFTDDMAGYVNKSMTILMDGMYPKMVSHWTKTKMYEMVERGYHCGGFTPFGYKKVIASEAQNFHKGDKEPPKRLVPDPTYAPVVEHAYKIFAEQSSYASVVRYLNSVTERQWSFTTTVNLLKNEVYKGVQVFGEARNETAHPPIVPAELWEAAQQAKIKRAREPKQDPVDKSSFYLRSIIYCGNCGGRMTPANHHGRTARVRYYECICDGKRTKACPIKRVNAESIHNAVLHEIRRAAEHPTRMTEIIREAVKLMPRADKSAEILAGVARRLRDVGKKEKNIVGIMETGGSAVKSLVDRLTELGEERTRLESEMRQLEQQIAETRLERPSPALVQAHMKCFLTIWDMATEVEKGKLLPLLVERVEMTEKERGFCRLSFQPQKPRFGDFSTSTNVVINSKMGAGVGLEPTTSGL